MTSTIMEPNRYIRKVMTATVIFLCLFSAPVHAEDTNADTAAIENLGLFGGDLWDVAVDENAEMVYTVAKDSPNGFYRSNDAGATWTGISGDGIDYGGGIGVEVDRTTGDVYTTFSLGLYKSTDQGVTFTQVLEDQGMALVVAHDTILVSSNQSTGSVWVSTDQANTFTEHTVVAGESIWWGAAAPTAGTFYLITYSDSATHLYRTTDYGSTWSQVSGLLLSGSFAESHVCVDPVDANRLIVTGGYSGTSYYSNNAGSSWTALSQTSVHCTFDQQGRIYVGDSYSDDQGASWGQLVDDADTTALGGHSLFVDPSDDQVLYADGMPGLSKSTDRGATWTDINDGILGVTITDISQATDKDIVWAAAYNGVAKTENFTADEPTWQFPVLEDPATAIWVNPTDPTMVVVGEIGAMKRTTDGGATWTDVTGGLFNHDFQVTELLMDRTTNSTLYASLANGEPNNVKYGKVLRSLDQGSTWEDLGILDDAGAQSISQASNGDLFVGAGAEAGTSYQTGVYKYSAGVWTHLTDGLEEEVVKIIVDPEDDQIIYAVASIAYGNGDSTNFGFYKSDDAGATWTKITTGLGENREYNSLAIQTSTNPNTLYLGAANRSSQGVLYKSSDGGDNWGLQYTGLQDETFYTLMFDGVTIGSTRGLFDVKSRADLNLRLISNKARIGRPTKLRVTLQDAITGKKLRNKRVSIYRHTTDGKTFVERVRTNRRGRATLTMRFKREKTVRLSAKWKPTGETAEEFVTATSSRLRLRVR